MLEDIAKINVAEYGSFKYCFKRMRYKEKEVEMINNLLEKDLGICENLSCPFQAELTTFHHLLSPAGQIKLHVNYVKNIFQSGKTKLY